MAQSISQKIDHTYLQPSLNLMDVQRVCDEAIKHNFFSVCIPPVYIAAAKERLKNSPVKVATVVGFPFGYSDSDAKALETKKAIAAGADEIDMVCAIYAAKDQNFELVERDIRAVVDAAQGHTVKVILETALLTEEEKKQTCLAAVRAGAHFVKTSTGFASSGATIDDVEHMKKWVNGKAQVKASGGVRDRRSADAMIAAGATRLGTSNSIAITRGEQATMGPSKNEY